MHLAMDPAHRALRARHYKRHVLGKPLFPAILFTFSSSRRDDALRRNDATSGDEHPAVPVHTEP